MAHGDTIVHRDGIEFERNPARLTNSLFHLAGEDIQPDMARYDVGKGIGHADKGFFHVLIGHTDGLEQAPVSGAVNAFFNCIGNHGIVLLGSGLKSGLKRVLIYSKCAEARKVVLKRNTGVLHKIHVFALLLLYKTLH